MRLLLLSILIPLFAPGHCAEPSDVVPSEGAALTYTHVAFEWDPICFADGYELAIVEDDGSADPFTGGSEVTRVAVAGLEPRTVVTSGLEFGQTYAWRVRATQDAGDGPPHGHGPGRGAAGAAAGPSDWSAAYRFETKRLPESLPELTLIDSVPDEMEPGLTTADLAAFPFPPAGFLRAIALDRAGQVVWFNEPILPSIDTGQPPNGRITYSDNDRAYEATLDGEVTWVSLGDPSLVVHHEVFPMPNGNIMTIVWDRRDVELGGEIQSVRGDRIVEFDRETKEIVWSWATHDNYSLLDAMPGTTPADGNWTHVNAVVYDEVQNTVTISSRNLSRITRIDYATGEIIFNMGMEMPSGDVDFGDGLFFQQHAPEIQPNGNLLLHDNGNLANPVTRAIELEFDDPRNPTSATIAWEWTSPLFSNAIGDADRLPGGNTLVASGLRVDARLYEVTPDGRIVWELAALDDAFFFYRAEQIEELHTRTPAEAFRAHVSAALHQASCRVPRR